MLFGTALSIGFFVCYWLLVEPLKTQNDMLRDRLSLGGAPIPRTASATEGDEPPGETCDELERGTWPSTADSLVAILDKLNSLEEDSVFREEFLGKRVRWKARVDNVDTAFGGVHLMFTPVGHADSARTGSFADWFRPGFNASFDRVWLPRLSSLHKGDVIRIEGLLYDPRTLWSNLVCCSILD